jgi:protein-S-isoprenylcysteine O-methyltransferase Ste14
MGDLLILLAILSVFIFIPAGITWSKGHRVAFFLGFLIIGVVWYVAACRLAYPSSWWARHFYGPKKMNQAVARFGGG